MAKKEELTIEEKLQAALIPKEEQPYEIPDSWVWVRLGSICYKITDGTHKTPIYTDAGIPFISVKDIYDNEIHFDNTKFISDKEHTELFKRCNPEKGDILVTKSGTIGRTAVVKTEKEFSLFVSVALIKNIKRVISSDYLSYDIKDYIGKINVNSDIKGAVIKNYHISDIQKQPIPLSPIKEQQRIVKKLDSLFEKTKKAKELIQEVKEEVEMRKISILDKAFRGELTKKWREKNKTGSALDLLQEIQNEKMKKWEEECCEAEKNGSKKPKKIKISKLEEMIVPKDEEPYEIPDTWKWVKLGEISQISMGQSPLGEKVNSLIGVGLIGGPSDMGENYPIITRYTSQITKLSSIGDIIVSIRATLGKNIFSDGEYCLGRGVCGIRSKIVNNILLRFYFTNSIEYLYKISSGTTFAQVSKEDISNLYFPLPPLEEQQEIVRVLEEVLEKEKKVKELIDLEEKIDLLEKSILDKAFRGKLGTQDINDEPALELLKKIIDKEE